jgi:hypothetical protein
MATSTKVIAVLLLPRHVPDVIKFGKTIVGAMTGNAYLPTPTPTLASVTTRLAELEVAETLAESRAKGAASARNIKLRLVDSYLQGLRAYVQMMADADLDHAVAIIESAGMNVKKHAVRVKSDLTARPGKVSGQVLLDAKAAAKGRASYDWEYSMDQKAWTPLPTTLVANTTVSGLTPLTTYSFRHRVLTRKDGQSDWHQVATLVVR